MRSLQKAGLIILLLIIYSCSSRSPRFGDKPGEIIISGRVHNFLNHKDHRTVQVICRDFFERQKKYNAEIDTNGFFSISFPSAYPQEFYLRYGALVTLFCNPGDSLFLEIDSDIQNDTKNKFPGGAYFCRFPETATGAANREINKFLEELPSEKYSFSAAIDAEKDKSPEEYRSYINQRGKEYSEFLEKFVSVNKPSGMFRMWVADHLKYESMNDLMRYRWTHPENNNMKRDSFQPGKDYFSFLEGYDMDDNRVFAISHFDFLHELYNYSLQNPRDSIDKAKAAAKEKNYTASSDIMRNMIIGNTTGFTRDLLLTRFYFDILKGQQLDIFEDVYDPHFTSQALFLDIVNSEYSGLKKYLANQDTEGANITSLKTDITTGLIDTISSRYRNKVIYIDFWAPWCSPCMAEMPNSAEMQSCFRDRDVVFLFLANQCREDSWKATIANKKITGEHILLTDDQFNILSGTLGINGIPHYTLVAKNGRIAVKDAPRPGDKTVLIAEIEKLLAEKGSD